MKWVRVEIVDRDGKSSLLSLIKAFDSVLAVYEGFCNLKQVDLKLKVCRGSSIRKVLVREAKFYLANEVIYCAKNLPKDCSILAVDNGKVVFQRKASPPMANGQNLIGKGGSSRVYRGCLPDGKELAVKILKQPEDLLKEFVLEIEIITALHHKNIISLFGFCFEDCNLLMVYDFLSRGSLEENLHGNKKDSRAFGWSERFKVAVGVAEALEYLHNCTGIGHFGFCTFSILMLFMLRSLVVYVGFQLSDFGLAKWASTSSSQITCTDVAGHLGFYLAPEYFMFGKVNEKIDVYAFGVAKSILKGGKVSQLLDPSMGNKYDHNQMERMVLAATLCIRRAPRARPQMSIVLKLLQGDSEVIKGKATSSCFEGLTCLMARFLPRLNLQSHLNVALLDVEEDSLSLSSIEQSASLKDYLQGRWSRSASFD
ncbi:Proline-rich receptor-like protein kinase PERK1 [Camellia lanceoleosa]|nr:Proline-rich receptor-like protein kinase PERK1 [Camellia lanceoleosa]